MSPGFSFSYGTPLGLIATSPLLPVYAAGVAKRVQHQTLADQFQVGFQNLFA